MYNAPSVRNGSAGQYRRASVRNRPLELHADVRERAAPRSPRQIAGVRVACACGGLRAPASHWVDSECSRSRAFGRDFARPAMCVRAGELGRAGPCYSASLADTPAGPAFGAPAERRGGVEAVVRAVTSGQEDSSAERSFGCAPLELLCHRTGRHRGVGAVTQSRRAVPCRGPAAAAGPKVVVRVRDPARRAQPNDPVRTIGRA